MQFKYKAWVLVFGLIGSSSAFADGADIHLVGGISLTSFGGSQYVDLGEIVDQVNTSAQETLSPFVGFGVGYEWDHLIHTWPLAFNLGVTGYYLNNPISGTVFPAVPYNNSLSYTASENSLAWMLEPKFIYTGWSWQPYFMGGIGVSANRMSDFSENVTDSDGGSTPSSSFSNKTNTDLAWEVGLGAQHTVYQSDHNGALIFAVEYRYTR